MTDSRNQILDAVRLGRAKTRTATSFAPGRQALLPPRFVRDAPDLLALFLAKLDCVSTSHAVLDRLADVPGHLAQWLGGQGLPPEIVIAPEPWLAALDWGSTGLRPQFARPAILTPGTVLSGAFAGVAETGSIAMLTNGNSRPSHNLFADSHVVVIEQGRILPTIEDVWRDAVGQGLPRSVAFITGASRTADIEMTMELGVHGAVRMHVIVVG